MKTEDQLKDVKFKGKSGAELLSAAKEEVKENYDENKKNGMRLAVERVQNIDEMIEALKHNRKTYEGLVEALANADTLKTVQKAYSDIHEFNYLENVISV